MKTRGEIEAAVCQGISQFEQEYMGRGPKDIHTHLLDDFLVVRRPPSNISSKLANRKRDAIF